MTGSQEGDAAIGRGSDVTVGIDLASQARNTAVCVIRWSQPVVIETAVADVDDRSLEREIARVTKVGIDVPLGWPTAFVNAVTSYGAGGPWEPAHTDPRLRLRATDLFAARRRGRNPLSVSTDRIALPAMRAARLLTSLDATFDRTGAGKVVEVYPAASLRAWGFNPDGYKGSKGRAIRGKLVMTFLDAAAPVLTMDQTSVDACVRDDDIFDAFICALTARASFLGICDDIPEEDLEVARSEGWIALPQSGSLLRLASGEGTEQHVSGNEDDFPLPAKDPSHTCPKCGEVPWAPADGFGRMCDACGWTWEIDRPHEGRYVSQGRRRT